MKTPTCSDLIWKRLFFVHIPLPFYYFCSQSLPNQWKLCHRHWFRSFSASTPLINLLSSAEASLCHKETGEKGKRARGGRWEGEKERKETCSRLYLFPSSPARFLFCCLTEPLRRRKSFFQKLLFWGCGVCALVHLRPNEIKISLLSRKQKGSENCRRVTSSDSSEWCVDANIEMPYASHLSWKSILRFESTPLDWNVLNFMFNKRSKFETII